MDLESEPGLIFSVIGTDVQIKAASLDKLIDKICDHTYRADGEFFNEFLQSYNYFTNAREILEGLTLRYVVLKIVRLQYFN